MIVSSIWSYFGFAAAMQGVVLSIIILTSDRVLRTIRVTFALLILSFSLFLVEFAGYWSPYLLQYPHFIFTTLPLPWLFGPLLLFIARRMMTPCLSCKKEGILHFVPAVIEFVLNFPFYVLSAEEKRATLEYKIYSDAPHLSFDFYITNAVLFGATLLYCANVLKLSRRVTDGQRYFLKGLSLGLIIFAAQNLTRVVMIYFTDFQFITEIGMILVSSAGLLIYMLAYTTIARPQLLEEAKVKYKNNPISQGKLTGIQKALADFIQQGGYRQRDMNLKRLSDSVGQPPHIVSQVVNRVYKMSIQDLINSLRIKDVKKMLVEPQYKHYKIMAIADEVGFTNKASFYNAFKKHVDMTPSEYLKTVKQ